MPCRQCSTTCHASVPLHAAIQRSAHHDAFLRCRAAAGDGENGKNKARRQQRAVVVGGGAGGLATAGRLARAGLDVTLLEKNAEVGGRVQSVEIDGCRWDTGPSLLLFPHKYREAFEALGTTLDQHVTLQMVQPAAYRVFFGDGSHLDLLNDPDDMASQLEGEEAGAGAAFLRFRAMARRMLDMGVPHFIDKDYTRLSDAAQLAELLPALPSMPSLADLLGPHDARLKQFFRDPRLRAMFTFQDLYVGLSPYTAPGVFSLLAGTELTDGVWYPLGGFQTVRDGLCQAAQACGVTVRTQAEVVAINTDSAGRRVTGVALASGEQLQADVVVCNRDLPAAFTLLDGSGQQESELASSSSNSSSRGHAGSSSNEAVREYARQRHEELGRLEYSAGVIAYNWKLSRRLDKLLHHNVFLSADYEASWQRATSAGSLLPRPNFYVHCPARTDPSAAPAGCDSVMVLLPVASLQQHPGSDYQQLVDAGRQRILQAFADSGVGQDVGAAISHEFVISPPEWQQRYGLRHGAAFGLSHGLNQLSIFRPGTKDPRLEGLYFVGTSTRPGNGVPLCLIGAGLTAGRVLQDLGLAADMPRGQ